MNNNARIVLFVVVGIAVLSLSWMVWDRSYSNGHPFPCDGKERRAIDMRTFETQYSAYSLALEAQLSVDKKVSIMLEPKQRMDITEALQQANEYRKFIVAGFNACAVTAEQYSKMETHFHLLDNIARQINIMLTKPKLTADESTNLTGLIKDYSAIATTLSK